ncbi:uncharacterized protein LOC130824737 [Amaranthus tricolor]|uniref:uncharacterized protein LOC130824737 n=1 Tax=Amaranthus tricolor TaxID=29722 RepID=UPI002584E212|nr:uncharacterized protein LOC130824737 [Amaranthus tricolor]
MNLEEKFSALVTMVEQLSMSVNELKETRTQTQQLNSNNEPAKEDKSMRIDVREFDGTSHEPETYVEWEKGVERYFEYMDTHPGQQYKIAKAKLTMLAATWLQGLQRQRQRENRPKIHSWERLRKRLRRKYIPTNYKQQLYTKWSNLRQDPRTVAECMQEGERLTALCEKHEPEERKIGRFLSGLREDLRERIEVMQNLTYEGACNSALTFEKSAKRRVVQPTPLVSKMREHSTHRAPTQNTAQDSTVGNRATAHLPHSSTAQHAPAIRETQQCAPIVKTIHVDNVELNRPHLQASSTCTTLHVDNVEMNGFYFTEDAITHTFHSSFKPPAQKPAQHLPASSSTGSHLPLISTTQPYIASISPYTARQLTAKEKEVNPKDVIPPTQTTQTPTHLLGRKEYDDKDDNDRHITKLPFYETITLHKIPQGMNSKLTFMHVFCVDIHGGFAHSGYPHLHFEHFSFACMYDLNPWNATTLVHLFLQDRSARNPRKQASTAQQPHAQVQTVANAYSVDAANSHVSPYHTSLELRTILFQEGGIEPYQLGSCEDSNNNPKASKESMNNNNKNNKNHVDEFYEACEDSDFIHTNPSSTYSDESNTSQNNQEDNQLIMRKQKQELKNNNDQQQAKIRGIQGHQQPLTNSTDQATLAGLPRRTQGPWEDVEGIIGISTLGPSHHGPRVLRMIIVSSWKLEAKVAQSSRTASQNMQQPRTTEQATLASSHRRDPNPLDDVEGRVGISAQGSSHHGPRSLLEVTGSGLKTEHKVVQSAAYISGIT